MSTSEFPNATDALRARMRERQDVQNLAVLVQVCMDVLGVGKDPDVQAHGVLSRLAAHDREIADTKALLTRLEVYGRVCMVAAIVVIVAVALNVYVTWRNELTQASTPAASVATRLGP